MVAAHIAAMQGVSPQGKFTVDERRIVRLVAAIQFINILDFIMVMPMGPDFAAALAIPTNRIGYVGGAYTAAAFVSGFVGSFYLDRLDRRKAIAVAMIGLVAATALGGLATGFGTLIAARLLAGCFGGPAAALSLAIISDSVAVERRGQAMGVVGGAFSLASVLGVPIGLKLAEWGGWRLPFFAVAALGVLIVLAAVRIMKPQRAHLADMTAFSLKLRLSELVAIIARRETQLALAAVMLSLFANFLLIPNLSAYFQFNLGYPRAHLSWLYACGGVVSFFSQRWGGRLVDRHGGTRVMIVIVALLVTDYFALFVAWRPWMSVLGLFTLFMTFGSTRYVIVNAVTSKVPPPHERAGFMSIMTAAQHLASSLAAFASSVLLVGAADGRLEYVPRLGLISIALTLIVPFLVAALEKRMERRKTDTIVRHELDVAGFD